MLGLKLAVLYINFFGYIMHDSGSPPKKFLDLPLHLCPFQPHMLRVCLFGKEGRLIDFLTHSTGTCMQLRISSYIAAATREFSILPSQNANATFMVKKCIISFLCAFNLPIDNENCTLQFSEDATYNNLSAPIQVPPNSPFTLRAIPLNKVFYYQVVVSTNGSTIFQQRSNFTPLYNGEGMSL